MARTFTTKDIQDVDIEQIVITRSRDDAGNVQVRVRSSVIVTLQDAQDPTRTSTITINLNKTIQELGMIQPVQNIRAAILAALRSQIA